MSEYPVIAVVRLTPRFVWRMSGNILAVLRVGRLEINVPRVVRAVLIWRMCRKQFPARVMAVPDVKAE